MYCLKVSQLLKVLHHILEGNLVMFLRNLMQSCQPPDFILHDLYGDDEVEAWVQQGEDLGADWCRLLLRVW